MVRVEHDGVERLKVFEILKGAGRTVPRAIPLAGTREYY